MGPTGTGKTTTALAIAQKIPCEIISVDSALVYRGMDIGTAKPNFNDLANIPHHLINIIDPTQSYSAMQFRLDALRLIREIHTRGKLPLLVGGTMLYFKVLQYGLNNLPSANLEIRTKLNEEIIKLGLPALYKRLAKIDPKTAERLKSNDKQRIQRALEIIAITGKPMSALLTSKYKRIFPFTLLQLALEPMKREILYTNIAHRFDLMLQNWSLINEVYKLREQYNLNCNLPSMRCIGYRQVWEYLNGAYSYTEMRKRGIIATRQLAKRQLTWLRTIPQRIIIDSNTTTTNTIQIIQKQIDKILMITSICKNRI